MMGLMVVRRKHESDLVASARVPPTQTRMSQNVRAKYPQRKHEWVKQDHPPVEQVHKSWVKFPPMALTGS